MAREILLAIETGTRYTNAVLSGIVAYADQHTDWNCRILGLHADLRFHGWSPRDFDGVLAHAYTGENVRRLRDSGRPCVDVSGTGMLGGLTTVTSDDDQIGRLAAEHLAGRGLRQFAVVAYGWEPFQRERRRGFTAALEDEYTVHAFDRDRQRDAPPLRHQLAGFLESLPTPVGMFVSHDGLAMAVMQVARECRLAIPHELAIIGADNDVDLCELLSPGLSSVDQGPQRIGWEAADELAARLRDPARAVRTVRVPPVGVVSRGSTDIAAIEDESVVLALRFLQEHFRRPLRNEDVARAAASSVSGLQKKFHQHVRTTIGGHLRHLRLQEARRLLVYTDLPIGRIARRCGFGNNSRMTTVFKQVLGHNPTHYRRRRTTRPD